MYFDSLIFIVFLAIVWLAYQITPDRHRSFLLLVASISFYATLHAPVLLFALAGVVVVSYCCGIWIHREKNEAKKRRLLWGGIAVNVLLLCGLKYLRFIIEFWNPLLLTGEGSNNLLITIGLSYYTLQAVSYLLDVYLEKVEPERCFGLFALYLAFFPKLLQGPIERAGDLLPQLRISYRFDSFSLRSGLLLFSWGFFKKVAVANRLAVYVDTVYGDVHSYTGISLIMATYLYAIQIFADFSGYTDMALGVARMFNIQLTQNFNAPYLATSIADFWRRWHLSFSRWILDYIFKPLQMQWRGAANYGTAAALLVTFLFSGLWHGASWGFVIWGLLHGVFLATSVFYRPWQVKFYKKIGLQNHPLQRIWQTVITFNLLALAWIFFRANSVEDAWYVVTHLFTGVGDYFRTLVAIFPKLTQTQSLIDPILLERGLTNYLLMLIAVAIMLIPALFRNRIRFFEWPLWARWMTYYMLVLAISVFAEYKSSGFIYLQF